MYIIFLKNLHEGFNQYVPKKQIFDTRTPPWYNKRLNNLKNQKNKAYKRYRKDNNNFNLKILSQKKFDILNKFLYKSYTLSTEAFLRENSKSVWAFINSKNKTTGLPSFLYYNDKFIRPE